MATSDLRRSGYTATRVQSEIDNREYEHSHRNRQELTDAHHRLSYFHIAAFTTPPPNRAHADGCGCDTRLQRRDVAQRK